jgi:hypothetical protein
MGIVTDGLVGYWHYQQGVSGSTWENIAPATVGQYNGAINGAVLQSDGMYFDGVDDSAVILSLPELAQATVELGIIPETQLNAVNYFFDNREPGTANTNRVSVYIDSSNNLKMYLVDESIGLNSHIDSNFNSSTSTQELLTLVNDGTTNAIYKNNVKSGTMTNLSFGLTDGNIYLGDTYTGGFRFKGKIQYLRLYDRALTSQEITQNYNVGTNIGIDGGTTDPPPDTTPPSEVTNLSESHTDTTIDLSWTNPTDSDFSHCNVYRDGSLVQSNVTSVSYGESGLLDNTSYTYKITTVDSTGNESTGVTITVTTNETPTEPTDPPPDTENPPSDVITGSGTAGDPYVLYKAEHLNAIANNVSAHYKINNNIDATGLTYAVPQDFSGTLDGNGKVVSNLTIPSGGNQTGFIGKTASGGLVKNVGVENANMNGGMYSGIVVGWLVSGSVLETSYSTGVISGSYQLGGLVGFNQGGAINNCFTHATVNGNGTTRIAGLVGRGGGAVNCYAVSVVNTSTEWTGGALTAEGSSTNSYWDMEATGETYSSSGTGLNTPQMQMQTSFSGWDFDSIWYMPTNDYPRLQVFQTVAEPTLAPAVTIVNISAPTADNTLSDETNMDRATITFKFDQDVTEWRVRTVGTDPETGILADSGGAVSAGTEITAEVDWTELYGEGQNRVNIYGKNASGQWTPYG